MFVEAKLRGDADVKRYQPSTKAVERLARTLRGVGLQRAYKKYSHSIPTKSTLFADDRTRWGDDPFSQIPSDADVIHLHWVGGFLDYPAFFRWLPKDKPLVVTLHDMANFTGGCCFDLECGKFTESCGACPQLGSNKDGDLTRQIWRRKQNYYSTLNAERVRLVSPCVWMANEAKRSPLFGRFEATVIPNGLDVEVYKPRDCRVSRELLGIPVEAKVVLFLADNISQYRKGSHVLARALEHLETSSEVFLLSLGKDPIPELLRFRHAHFDDITNDRVLSYVYSAADVFVIPSLADNFPNTALESIACGTPVVGFGVGGVPELVRHGITGFVAQAGNAEELKDAVLQLLSDAGKRSEMARECRRVALAEYDVRTQAKRYCEIYQSFDSARSAQN
jgi:glycosyltransferase involved in cell wall biosynthesis